MNKELDQSRLDQTRKSIRSRVTRQSMTQSGVPIDLTPVLEEGQRRFGKVGLAIVTLVGLAALLWFVLRPMTGPPARIGEAVASVVVAHGDVSLFSATTAQGERRLLDLQQGMELYAGMKIESGGAPERVALEMADGKSLRLDTGTAIEIASASAVVLERGSVYIDSANALAGMEVRTTLGVVRDIGTQFEVRILGGEGDESLRVRVREGMVLLRHRQEDHEAGAGEELEMQLDGTLARRPVAIYGPEWDWVLEAAPAPDLRSIKVQTLVDWLARETGKTFRFADEEYAQLAPTLVVNGYVGDDQSAMEAVEGLLDAEGLEMKDDGEGVVVLVKTR